MSTQPSDFSGYMILVLVLSFFVISYFMGMLVHSAWMYEDKGSVKKDSRTGWIPVSYTHLTLPTSDLV